MNPAKIGSRVIVTADVEGTGIKKGMEGAIIAIQDGFRVAGRSTDLSGYAFQVRFNTKELRKWEQQQRSLHPGRKCNRPRGGMEIWLTPNEVIVSEASTSLPSESQEPDGLGSKKRTKNFDISFVDGLAGGWAFGVHESFKDQLDILYTPYVDKKRSKEMRAICPKGADGKPPTVFLRAWSRGVPPLLKFTAGGLFYDPPGVRRMAWRDGVKALRRTVRVVDAQPEVSCGIGGRVSFELCHWEGGAATTSDVYTLSQAEFEKFLRSGQLPPDINVYVKLQEMRIRDVATSIDNERPTEPCRDRPSVTKSEVDLPKQGCLPLI